jgi:hypothetical protein
MSYASILLEENEFTYLAEGSFFDKVNEVFAGLVAKTLKGVTNFTNNIKSHQDLSSFLQHARNTGADIDMVAFRNVLAESSKLLDELEVYLVRISDVKDDELLDAQLFKIKERFKEVENIKEQIRAAKKVIHPEQLKSVSSELSALHKKATKISYLIKKRNGDTKVIGIVVGSLAALSVVIGTGMYMYLNNDFSFLHNASSEVANNSVGAANNKAAAVAIHAVNAPEVKHGFFSHVSPPPKSVSLPSLPSMDSVISAGKNVFNGLPKSGTEYVNGGIDIVNSGIEAGSGLVGRMAIGGVLGAGAGAVTGGSSSDKNKGSFAIAGAGVGAVAGAIAGAVAPHVVDVGQHVWDHKYLYGGAAAVAAGYHGVKQVEQEEIERNVRAENAKQERLNAEKRRKFEKQKLKRDLLARAKEIEDDDD